MAWTNIANANLDVGAPVRSVDILALRDNVSAVPNGDTGAPRIKAEALNGGQSGNAPIYAARAWVNFNGSGIVSIRASGNVSSITDNGTGYYTVNFTTAMPDSNYAMVGSSAVSTSLRGCPSPVTLATTYVSIRTTDTVANYVTASTTKDHAIIGIAIFR